MQSRKASTGGSRTALWGSPCSCTARPRARGCPHSMEPTQPVASHQEGRFPNWHSDNGGCFLQAGRGVGPWAAPQLVGLLRAKRWSSASAVFCEREVACRRHSVGWVLGGVWRTEQQSLAQFLSLARAVAKAYLLAFEELCFEASRSPRALAVASILPPPVASTEHRVHCGTAPVVTLAWSLLKKGAFQGKMC